MNASGFRASGFWIIAALGPSTAHAQVDWSNPATEPQSSAAAQFASDEYAWRLFVALNWPANPATRAANASMKLGEAGPVVWETWANARDVFLENGGDPGAWLQVGSGSESMNAPSRGRFDTMPLQQVARLKQLSQPIPLFDPEAALDASNETRMNKDTFEFIRSNELYNLDGQVAFFARGEDLNFPLASKEIKAQWRPVTATDSARYHTVEITQGDGTKVLFGLTALHITTKDIPNWLWATFEHVDNPNVPGNEPWLLKSRDSFACRNRPSDCNQAPVGIGLEETKWEHYRLRGTQIEFIDSRGVPTLLANSQPEAGFQQTSSCMTCHARSTINGSGSRLPVFDNTGQGHVGAPDPRWYFSDGAHTKRTFTQQDFVWSLFRASPKR